MLTTLFELLARDGKWDEALPLVDRDAGAEACSTPAQAKHKKSVLYHMLASGLRDQDRAADALTQARRAVKADPGFAPGVALAGELALQAGRRRLALQILEEGWKRGAASRHRPGLRHRSTPARARASARSASTAASRR